MSAVALAKRWPIRITRAFLILAFAWNLIWGTYDVTRGHIFGLACLVLLPAIVVTLAWQVHYLRRAEIARRPRPRPDYASIAAMERELYGETFEHEGAPRTRGIDPEVAELHAMMDDLAERATALRERQPRWRNFDGDRKAMRDLAERATARRACISCGYPRTIASGRCGACYRQWKERRGGTGTTTVVFTSGGPVAATGGGAGGSSAAADCNRIDPGEHRSNLRWSARSETPETTGEPS